MAYPSTATTTRHADPASSRPPRSTTVVSRRVVQLDREARGLAALLDRSLAALARTAGAFVARECWSVLGYARLGDCARERLGRSARWVRNLAALDRAVAAHPALERALRGADGGPPLRRAAALVVARVADSDDVGRWIEAGRRLTVRALKVAAARARQGLDPFEEADVVAKPAGSDAVHAGRGPLACEACAGDCRCCSTRHGSASIDDAAPGGAPDRDDRSTPGSDDVAGYSGPNQLRAVAGLEFDAASAERVSFRLAVPRAVAVAFDETLDLFRSISGGEAPVTEFLEALVAEHLAAAADEGEGEDPPLAIEDGRRADLELWRVGELVRESRIEQSLEEQSRGWKGLEHGPVEVEEDEDWRRMVEALASEAGEGDAGALLERLQRWIRIEDEAERRLGRVLARLGECGAWLALRFTGPGHYARERLGLARSAAEDRAWLARSLSDYPLLRAAYETGRLRVEATLLVRRVLSSGRVDEEVERSWVEHAEVVTVRRLRDEARAYRWAPFAPRAATRCEESATGRKLAGPPSDEAWYGTLERGPGRTRERLLGLALEIDPLEPPDVFLGFRLPGDAGEAFRRAIGSARAALEGQIAVGQDGEAPSEVLARTCSRRGRRVPSWLGLLRLLEGFVAVWDPTEQLARTRRSDAVYRRAGWRCEVPGCTSRSNLEDHHIVYRSHGGGNDLRNRKCECRWHHQRGEHGGLLSCGGTAPLDVTWRLGAPRFATWYKNDRRLEVGPSRR